MAKDWLNGAVVATLILVRKFGVRFPDQSNWTHSPCPHVQFRGFRLVVHGSGFCIVINF